MSHVLAYTHTRGGRPWSIALLVLIWQYLCSKFRSSSISKRLHDRVERVRHAGGGKIVALAVKVLINGLEPADIVMGV